MDHSRYSFGAGLFGVMLRKGAKCFSEFDNFSPISQNFVRIRRFLSYADNGREVKRRQLWLLQIPPHIHCCSLIL